VNSGDMEVQKKKKETRKGKGKSWLTSFIWFCYFARHAIVYCVVTQFATKAASSCFEALCVANAVKGGAHEQWILFFSLPNMQELRFAWNANVCLVNKRTLNHIRAALQIIFLEKTRHKRKFKKKKSATCNGL
jgi:hypothetical protein